MLKKLIITSSVLFTSCSSDNDRKMDVHSTNPQLIAQAVKQNSRSLNSADYCIAVTTSAALGGAFVANLASKGCAVGGLVLVPFSGGASTGATVVCGVLDVTEADTIIGGILGTLGGAVECGRSVVQTLSENVPVSHVFQHNSGDRVRPKESAAIAFNIANRCQTPKGSLPMFRESCDVHGSRSTCLGYKPNGTCKGFNLLKCSIVKGKWLSKGVCIDHQPHIEEATEFITHSTPLKSTWQWWAF